MHMGCCAYSFRDALTGGKMTLSEFLRKCVEMDMDGVELTAYYFKDTSKEALYALKREAYRLGLDICGTAVGSSFTSPDEAKRREQVGMVKEWIDRSVLLGAPGIRVFAGSVAEGTSIDQAFEWTTACLKECADFGQSHGVMVALENHGGITSTADQTIRIVKAVNHPWLGINLDCGNYRDNPIEEIRKTAPHAVTAHAKVTVAGGGKLDYRQVVRALAEAGFRGYLNIEYEEKEDPMTAVPAFAKELRAAIGG